MSQTSQFFHEGQRASPSRPPCSPTLLILPHQSSFPIILVAPDLVVVVEVVVVVDVVVVVGIDVVVGVRKDVGE